MLELSSLQSLLRGLGFDAQVGMQSTACRFRMVQSRGSQLEAEEQRLAVRCPIVLRLRLDPGGASDSENGG